MGGLIAAALLIGVCSAGDPELALSRDRFTDEPVEAGRYFGNVLAAGDFDADGYRDAAMAGQNQRISVFPGSPFGPTSASRYLVELQDSQFMTSFGAGLAALDFNGDGYDDLVAAAYYGTPTYRGGPGGLSGSSERVVQPVDANAQRSVTWGASVSSAGDVDGDGFEDLLVGNWGWTDYDADANYSPGAAFLYSGGPSGLEACSEIRIDNPDYVDDGQQPGAPAFGYQLAGDGDLNADGYGDFGVGCFFCGIPECSGCSTAFVWSGGGEAVFSAEAAVQLLSGVESSAGDFMDYFAYGIEFVGDVDADGFGDVAVSSSVGQYVFFGSPTGLDTEHPQRTEWNVGRVGVIAGAGDVDSDGYDDVLFGTYASWWPDSEPSAALVLFGGSGGIQLGNALETTSGDVGSGFGDTLQGLGDADGDGRGDFLVGAPYEGELAYGAVYAFSPACSWYLDADADGYGAPGAPIEKCREQAGYASRPDDCDDTDAAVHGALWYPDADGDGYGVSAGAALACTQPANTATNTRDCDDGDARRHPGAEDASLDGLDQDCDQHDGPWQEDTGDCADSGETGADTSSDSETAGTGVDTAPDGETGAVRVDTAPADEKGSVSAGDPGARDCGCGGGAAPGFFGVLALGSVSVLARRRRSLP